MQKADGGAQFLWQIFIEVNNITYVNDYNVLIISEVTSYVCLYSSGDLIINEFSA